MTGKLAVFTSQLGTASETFIRRHVEDLLPGRTVVVARNSTTAFDGYWHAPCPVLFLDRFALRLPVRLAGRIGVSQARLRDSTMARFLRHHGATVILGEYLDQFADFVPLLDRMQLPYIVQGHGIDVSASLRKPGMAERYRSYNSAAAILTRCEFHRLRLIELGLRPDKVQVNPGGVDVPNQVPARPAEAGKRFLAIGRFVPKKGPIYLLEAFRLAAAGIEKSHSTISAVDNCCRRLNNLSSHAGLRIAYAFMGPRETTSRAGSRGSAGYSSNIALPIPKRVMRKVYRRPFRKPWR